MDFRRRPTPHVIEPAKVMDFIVEHEIAAVFLAADPFSIDDRCEFNPTGAHYAVGSCGDVVCCYCARIFWR